MFRHRLEGALAANDPDRPPPLVIAAPTLTDSTLKSLPRYLVDILPARFDLNGVSPTTGCRRTCLHLRRQGAGTTQGRRRSGVLLEPGCRGAGTSLCLPRPLCSRFRSDRSGRHARTHQGHRFVHRVSETMRSGSRDLSGRPNLIGAVVSLLARSSSQNPPPTA